MKLTKGNLVMYKNQQMTVMKSYNDKGIDYVDLQHGHSEKFYKVPAEDVFFVAKKRSKYI